MHMLNIGALDEGYTVTNTLGRKPTRDSEPLIMTPREPTAM